MRSLEDSMITMGISAQLVSKTLAIACVQFVL